MANDRFLCIFLVLMATFVCVLPGCGRVAKAGNPVGPTTISETVTRIAFSNLNYQIGVGSILDMAGQVSPNMGERTLIWSIDDPSIATVSAQGTVEGLVAGETVVRVALASNLSVSAAVSLRVSATQNVQLTQTNVVLYKLDTITLGLQGNTGITTLWRSSSPNVAAVDSTTGLVVAANTGEATITAYDERSGDPIGSCRVKVESKVRGITVSQSQVTVPRSSTFSIQSTSQVVDSTLSTRVDWHSSNEAVVRLLTTDSNEGIYTFTAVGVGVASLTARSAADGTISRTIEVQVIPPNTVAGFSVYPNSLTLERGSTTGFVVSIEPVQVVSWSSSVPSVASINPTTGVITGISSGSTVVTARAVGGQTVTVPVSVREVEISEVVISPRSTELNIGDVQALTVSVFPDNAVQTVNWSVTDSSILQLITNVSPPRVVALKPGRAQVIATSLADGSIRGLMDVVVKTPAVTAINVLPSTVTIYQGETTQLSSSVSPALADQSVIWQSLDDVYATVSGTGLVTGVLPGTVQIEGRSVSNPARTARATVTILPISVSSVVASGPLVLDLGTITTYNATVVTLPSRPSAVRWRSSNEYQLRINPNSGQSVAVAPGSVTIYATSVANNSRQGELNVAIDPPNISGTLDFSVLSRVYWSPAIGQNATARAVFLTPAELNDIRFNQSSSDSLDWVNDLNHGTTLQTGNYYIVVYIPEIRTDQYAFVQSLQYVSVSKSIIVNIVRVVDPQFPKTQTSSIYTSYVRIVLEIPKSLLPINSNINTATPLTVLVQNG